MKKFTISYVVSEITNLFANLFSFSKKEWALCPIRRDYTDRF